MSPTKSKSPLHTLLGPGGALSRQLPGYEYRAEQEEVCTVIDEAFSSGRHCMVEAGTGVGKTVAYLIPAFRAAARGKVTLISTHTLNLQSQLIEKDIPLVSSLLPKPEIKAVVMKGKGNYLCKQDLDSADADLFNMTDPLFRELKAWVRETKTGDVAELPFSYGNWSEVAANQDTCRQKDCHYFERCFYYDMRRNAGNAQIIVVNHALFLSDLAIRREEPQSAILPDYDFVVIDEAHHLEDVATRVFGLEIGSRRIAHFADRIKRTRGLDVNTDRLLALDKLNEELFQAFDYDRPDFFFEDVLKGDADTRTRETTTQICVTLEGVQLELLEAAKEAEGPLKDRLQGMARGAARIREELHTIIFRAEPEYIRWGQRAASMGRRDAMARAQNAPAPMRTTLHYTPIEVGKLLKQLLWDPVKSVVLTSATLANSGGFSYLRSRLAVPESAIERVVGSPFDYREQALLYVPAGLPAPPKGPDIRYSERLAEEIERVVKLSDGRAFLLFTSRRMLNEVFEILSGKLPFPLFRQGDMPPARLLDAFRESGDGVLFGTQTFWEGVDVQGQALSCVVIDRLPFGVPDSPVTRARTEAITAAGGDWFKEYSVPQAQIRLKQGFGRLIRTREDRGIVCILDTRLLTKNYGPEFVKYLPPATRASMWNRVERFWHGSTEAPAKQAEPQPA